MADKPLFSLAAEGRWRLAYDSQQWVIQHWSGKARAAGLEARPSRGSGWEGASFIGSEKRVLRRVLGEKGVILTAEAQARLDTLPDMFMDFIAAPERLFARPEAVAALVGHGLTPPESTEALSAAT